MNKRFGTIVLDTSFRFIIPFIMVYSVYVLIHGEDSPGGGFQAGALFGIVFVLSRLVQGEDCALKISGTKAIMLAGVGTAIYGFVGVLTLIFGGNFLQYGALPLNMHEPERHAMGILGIEIGVTLCVMATIIAIFDALTRREEM
ncbi:MAG: MnhB domain-containing protein [Clostridia bacterium]|nr:MnhB domain-containing protein [Clostridia bacterium]MDD4047418.1 MnhB domain-containing protein [Clostridia bacterium]